MDLSHPLLAATLDDPPPFPTNQTQLIRLDRALYCQICKEFYQGPVTISCGHSFCSQCIRSSLESMKKCPVCGETAGEGGIRRNRALEEIVDSWEEARAVMITLSQPHATSSSRKRPIAESNSRIKRMKREDSATSRSQSPAGRNTGLDEGGAINVPSSDGADSGLAKEGEEDEEEIDEDVGQEGVLSENDEGECPICSARLSIAAIPGHIERGCPPVKKVKNGIGSGSGNQKADWKRVFGGVSTSKTKDKEYVGWTIHCTFRSGPWSQRSTIADGKRSTPMKRITKPNYHLATPSELRSLLTSYSLSTTGDKPTLETRVQDWILLYNSNLDTSHPKSLSALKARLNEIEASKKRDKEKGKDALGEQLASKEGVVKYVKERAGEFEKLRKDILARKEQSEKKGKEGAPIEIE